MWYSLLPNVDYVKDDLLAVVLPPDFKEFRYGSICAAAVSCLWSFVMNVRSSAYEIVVFVLVSRA